MVNIPKKIAIWSIVGYQRTLSPDHGLLKHLYPYGYCRHYPTCSEYSKQAIERFGFVKGVYLGILRIVRCNPFVESSFDPIPNH